MKSVIRLLTTPKKIIIFMMLYYTDLFKLI